MSSRIPQEIASAIKETVFAEAAKVNYLALSPRDSGEFINFLVSHPDIGGEVSKYKKREQVRHYIKDAILNRYSKNRFEEAAPKDVRPIIKETYGLDVERSPGNDKVLLYRSTGPDRPNEYVVVARGTYVKWETALRKALLYISAKPFSQTANDIHILLLLFSQDRPVPQSDRKHLRNVLHRCDAAPYIF